MTIVSSSCLLVYLSSRLQKQSPLGYLDKFRFCPVCGSQNFNDHDFKSRRCADCGFTFYFNAAAACAVIITNEQGQLLVARRAEEPQKGTLDLIGGFVDPGESSDQAVIREIREETGIDILPLINSGQAGLRFLFSIPSTYLYSGLTIHSCDAFYHVQIPSDTTVKPDDDVAECFWLNPADINPDLFGLTSIRTAVRRYIEG